MRGFPAVSFPVAITLAALVLGEAAAPGSSSVTLRAQSPKVDASAVYKARCAMCHGPKGDSKLPGMSFTDGEWKHGSSVKELTTVIRDGVEGTAMLPFKGKLTDAEIEALAVHVRAFDLKLKSK